MFYPSFLMPERVEMKEVILSEYRKYLVDTEKAGNTMVLYLRETEKFMDFVAEKTICKEVVMEYKRQLLKIYKKTSTINAKITAVNRYLEYAGLPECRVKTIKIQTRQCPENILTKGEYEALLSYALESGRQKHYLIMRTLALTGCRISELKGLTVQALSDGMYQVCNKGKVRDIYLPDKLIEELRCYCVERQITKGCVFLGNKGKPISRNGVYRMLQRMADMTGVPKEKAHPHSFRHLFALTYIDTYNNIGELADILGHSSLEITRIYMASSREQKRKKMNQLNL